MRVEYCHVCGMRLGADGIAGDEVFRDSKGVAYCKKCGPSSKAVAVAPPRPVAAPSPSARRAAAPGREEKRAGLNPGMLIGGAGIVCLLISVLLYSLNSSAPESAQIAPNAPRVPNPAQTPNNSTPVVATPAPESPVTPPVAPLSVTTMDPRTEFAAHLLENAKRIRQERPSATLKYRFMLEELATHHKSTPAGAEAAKLLADLPPQPASEKGLVGHWSFDETDSVAKDSSGYGNDGPYRAKAARITPGRKGEAAASFHGELDMILINDATELRPADAFTVCAWVRPSEKNASGGHVSIISKGRDNAETYSLEIDPDGRPLILTRDARDAKIYSAVAPEPLAINQWTHVAGVYTAESLNIYINAKRVVRVKMGKKPLSSDATGLGIGNAPDGRAHGFIGDIDDVRIYSRTLEQPEIAELAK